MKLYPFLTLAALGPVLGGCYGLYGNDELERYVQRKDTVTLGAGDAKEVNAVTHMDHPWPRGVGDRRIVVEASRAVPAIERYRAPPRQQQGASPAAIGAAAGAGQQRVQRLLRHREPSEPTPASCKRCVMKGPIANLAKATRAFWQDTDGIILPYVTLMLVVIVGTSLLALDGARYMSLQSQLQKGADALAIAGAAELDRMPDSTGRAVNAINNLITNSSVFGTGGTANVTDAQIRFTSTLPADSVPNVDAHVICTGTGCTAAQSVAARFVEVTVTPTTIPTILPASFVAWRGPTRPRRVPRQRRAWIRWSAISPPCLFATRIQLRE